MIHDFEIGGRKFKISAATVGHMLDFEAWAQQQIMESAKLLVADTDKPEVLLAEAAKRASATGYYSEDSQRIRASVKGVLCDLWMRARAHDKRITYVEFEALCRKHNDDFYAAIKLKNEIDMGLNREPSPPKDEAKPETRD